MKKLIQSPVVIIVLLVVTFGVRLYRLNAPVADWHSWRQVDTAAVSRSFVNQGFDLLHPRFEDISNVPSGFDNPMGYRFVEFPIYNVIHASAYMLLPLFSLEIWGRIITIVASTFTTLFLYLLVKRHTDSWTAFFVGFFYALLPFSIYYGRVILPDPSMVMAITGGIYFFDRWINSLEEEKARKNAFLWLLLSWLFTTAAFLLKPYALFFTLPMIVLAWNHFRFKLFTQWRLWLYLLASIIPLILWRVWMTHYPEGIPVSDWLFNGGNIRFKGAYFYWIYADRLGRLILGYWGMGLFIIGLLVNSNRAHWRKHGLFFYAFLLSSLLYVTVIARGNVQHDYYQILILPTLAIFMGLGARIMAFPPKEYISVLFGRGLLVVCIAASLGFSWFFVRDYFNINNPSIVTAGEAVDRLTPRDAKIVAPYDGDTTLLYYTKRQGWPSFEQSLPELAMKGATHLLLINPTEKDLDIGKEYKIVAQTKEYLLFDLRQRL